MSIDALINEVMVPPPARGRRAKPVFAEVKREVTPADVQALWDLPEGGLGSVTNPLVKLRFQHHYLARLLAEGRSETEAALCTGYSVSRVSILKKDPAFSELVSYYKTQVEEVFVNVHQRLAALGLNSVEELMERLDIEPERFSNNELMELTKITFDRAGFGPSSTVKHNHTHGLAPDVMEKLKNELESRAAGKVRPLPSNSGGPTVGGTVIEGTLAAPEASEGSESSGAGV